MLCWFLVQTFGLGHKGAALATSISYWFNVALLAIYVKVSEAGRRSWNGWSREALKLKDVKVYLRLAIPSTFMTCLEYWAFEMVILLAGFLPDPKLETSILSISLNTMWMVYTIPSGLSSAISSLIICRTLSNQHSMPFLLKKLKVRPLLSPVVAAISQKMLFRKLAQKDAHSNSGAHKVSGVNVIHGHHTVDNTAESSHAQSHLDEAPAAQDSAFLLAREDTEKN